MKKLLVLALAVCLLAPLGMAQFSASVTAVGDDGSTISVSNTGYTGPRTPGSLTTLFAQNNGFRGNMFDMTPTTNMLVQAVDVNVDPAGLTANVDVWYYVGTCVGHDTSQTGWTLLGSGSGIAAGVDLPTNIPLPGASFVFQAGQVYGIYVDVTNYPSPGINYTNGTVTVFNADLSITTFYGKGDPAFTGSTFNPRAWNGTVYYDTGGTPTPLFADVKEIKSHKGGIINFYLNATSANAGRNYALIGGVSGNVGFPLPGGLVVPVTWDILTTLLIKIGWGLGTLDVDGKSTQMLAIPAIPQSADVTLTFGYFLEGWPWDYVSNTVDVVVKAWIPPVGYFYDDGTIENALGLTAGGDMCWMHFFDCGPGDIIKSLESAFGNPNSPGSCPGAGTPIDIFIWDDPTNDNDPTDAAFLATAVGVLANPDTNTLNNYAFTSPVAVNGVFLVGCMVNQPSGNYPGPMDETPPYAGFAWVCGDTTSSFDYNNLYNNDVAPLELSTIGYPANWLLRAIN